MSSDEELIVGIDLGTTYSCVACFKNGSIEVIEAPNGDYTFPSILSFLPTELHIGAAASSEMTTNADNFVYGVKRLIGKAYTDPDIADDLASWEYSVEKDPKTNQPRIKVNSLGEIWYFSPEEISAFVLHYIRTFASHRLGVPIKRCIITVPAYFSDTQRNATKTAGILGGWDVVRVINEPTAAAFDFAYSAITRNTIVNKTILVFDLGGGTFDVSVLRIEDKNVITLATGGDNHFGGQDFDQYLTKHLLSIIDKQYNEWLASSGKPPAANGLLGDIKKPQSLAAKVRKQAIMVKESLSSMDNFDIGLSELHSSLRNIRLSRAEFDKICSPLYERIAKPIYDVLQQANVTSNDIDDVILVGGSSRIQHVTDIIEGIFTKEEQFVCSKGVANPDRAIAMGAALVGATLSNHRLQKVENAGSFLQIKDVISHGIGLVKAKAIPEIVLPAYSPYPISKTIEVVKRPGARALVVAVSEIDGNDINDISTLHINKLGNVRLNELDPENDDPVKVTFSMDANAILTVKLSEEATDKTAHCTFNSGLTAANDSTGGGGNGSYQEHFDAYIAQLKLYEKWFQERLNCLEPFNTAHENAMYIDDDEIEEQYVENVTFFKSIMESIEPLTSLKDKDQFMALIAKLQTDSLKDTIDYLENLDA